MKFEWDETKRQTNLRKHRLDLADAQAVFLGVTLTINDGRFDYDEDRFITVGLLNETVVVIAHTERADVIRIISMRKATRNEQRHYFRNIAD